jgi:hypothetical protein
MPSNFNLAHRGTAVGALTHREPGSDMAPSHCFRCRCTKPRIVSLDDAETSKHGYLDYGHDTCQQQRCG